MNRSRTDNGSVAVEVVLITPALVTLLLLAVLGGRLTGAQSRVRHAAASAARAASLRGSFAAAEADAVATAEHDLERANVECSGGPTVVVEGAVGPGDRLTVTVRCSVPLRDLGLLGIGRAVHEVSATSVQLVDVRRSG